MPGSVELPRSPAFLAAEGSRILIADRGGNLLWWDWQVAPGPLVSAHGDGGPIVGDAWFATSGGWDPTVKRWDFGAEQPRYTVRPFDARVTAMCIQGDDLLVAGVNKGPAQIDAKNKDRVAVSAGSVVRIDAQGKTTPLALPTKGQIEQLVCGPGWLIAIDGSSPSTLLVVAGDRPSQLALNGGSATALASRGADAVVADRAGVWIVDPSKHELHALGRATDDSPRVLSLVAIGQDVFGGTSEGVIRWPGGQSISRDAKQVAALARLRQNLLILWEDGVLEERAPSGALVRSNPVPRQP